MENPSETFVTSIRRLFKFKFMSSIRDRGASIVYTYQYRARKVSFLRHIGGLSQESKETVSNTVKHITLVSEFVERSLKT